MRHIKRTAMLALSVALSLSGLSYAQVIEKVPADALAFVKVSNLSATSGKVAKLAEALGLNAFEPKLNDPLGTIKQEFKITAGLNDDGELAFVFIDPKGGDENKSMILLVPVSDYKAFVGGIEGATTDGDLTVTKGKDGTDAFIADWDGYAALSPNKALVAAAPSSFIKLPARAAKEVANQDVVLFANFAALREPLTQELNKNREKAKTDLLEELKGNNEIDAKYHPALDAAVSQFFGVAESFLRDTDAATIGLSLTDNGVKPTVVAEFKEGSYLGKLVGGLKNVDSSLLRTLPATKYLFFGGATISAEQTNQVIDDLAGPVIKALPADDETTKMIPDYVADIKKLLTLTQEQSFGMLVPEKNFGEGPLIQVVSSIKGDGKAIVANTKSMTAKYSEVMNQLMGEEAQVKMNQTWTDNAKEVDGLSFALVSTEMVGDGPMAQQQQQMMTMLYGTPDQQMFVADAGDEVLSFLGVSDDVAKILVANAKANESPLAALDTVKAVSAELPKARMAEFYVSLDEIMGLGLRTASQFGFLNANIQLPPDLQPLGVSLSSEGTSLEIQGYVSNDLLQALMSAGIQVYGAMQGGGGGNNGGL